MLDNRTTLNKYGAYFVIGFLVIIVGVTFFMPDVGCYLGEDPYTKVKINGQKFNPVEYNKYQKIAMGPVAGNEQMAQYFFQRFVNEVLTYQKAEDEGIEFSDQRLSDLIKKNKRFWNPETGKFDPMLFQNRLNEFNMTLPEYEKILRRSVACDELSFYMVKGCAVPLEDVKFNKFVSGTKIQIKYAFLSSDELRKRYSGETVVTDAEIDSEISSQNVKISDPKTDRERIRKQLEDKKLDKLKNDLIEKINAIASANGSFDTAAAVLNGKVEKSATFKIGEDLKSEGKEPKNLGPISGSSIFTDRLFAMGINSASPVINSPAGLYIFTPVTREFPGKNYDDAALAATRDELLKSSVDSIEKNMLMDLIEDSKIEKSSKN